jgi:hypothetical protein
MYISRRFSTINGNDRSKPKATFSKVTNERIKSNFWNLLLVSVTSSTFHLLFYWNSIVSMLWLLSQAIRPLEQARLSRWMVLLESYNMSPASWSCACRYIIMVYITMVCKDKTAPILGNILLNSYKRLSVREPMSCKSSVFVLVLAGGRKEEESKERCAVAQYKW